MSTKKKDVKKATQYRVVFDLDGTGEMVVSETYPGKFKTRKAAENLIADLTPEFRKSMGYRVQTVRE